ncbi:CMKK2 protein [Metarhizium album ARSEF 1941]|uniref:CMKK2 protein n=1 Tax=Metarhizium album (strain ARSEF 1941) TaxID=1081103 RepID=A0A0B2WNN6_METAS|nr:CMKK2 protein [Metarhizium album ARSEF 1941]KHN95107.1 CMKK2 protein [Metarhizium album ARSEF 1941]
MVTNATTPISHEPDATGLRSPRLTVDSVDDNENTMDRSRPTSVSEPPALHDYSSPMRQHKRAPSAHREIKETLDARVEFTSDEVDGRTYHRINQYVIVEEIGRGSYGAVHRATDQFGNEFAVKEFSKSRLRKRAQSHILRLGPHNSPGQRPPRLRGAGGPLSPQLTGLRAGEENDALFLIREEIAIMKKLNHPNLVQLIEVLDDPEEDSLYMVMEMCKKGVIMKVGLDENVDPYDDESCRYWFRDLLLGIEYLHAQRVVHRDIKPDNLLLSEDEVLKIVDFGVSEMFDKPDNMRISKSAGSPAFMPPELCGKHQEVSGKAADMWSMGVTLYCLRYGKIPFNRPTVLEIYEAIKSDDPPIPQDEHPAFVDLVKRILAKDPKKRIPMSELREHPWVTKGGSDPLLSVEDNCEHIIEPPNELELNRAFTRKMNHLLSMMKAIHKFRTLLARIRARKNTSVTSSSTSVQCVMSEGESFDAADDKAKAEEIEALLACRRHLLSQQDEGSDKGHAGEIGDQEPLLLGIGTGARDAFSWDEATPDVVADSPTAVDFDVYGRAYEEAVKQRKESTSSKKPTMYLTKFVEAGGDYLKMENLVEGTVPSPSSLKTGLKQATHLLKDNLSSDPGVKLAEIIDRVALSISGAEKRLKQPEPERQT